MKKLLFALLCVPMLALGQRQITVEFTPIVNNTIIDSLILIQGQDTIYLNALSADSGTSIDSASVVGVRVFGGGLPWGATVTKWIDTATIIISDTIVSATDSLGALQFEYFTQVQYASGDAMGAANRVYLPSGERTSDKFLLNQVYVVDTTDQGANFDIMFFSAAPAVQDTDNTPVSFAKAVGLSMVGFVAVDTWTDLGAFDLGYETPNLPIAQEGQLYYQLVSKGTATYTGARPFRIKLVFLVDE